jgi:hypothetical protein
VLPLLKLLVLLLYLQVAGRLRLRIFFCVSSVILCRCARIAPLLPVLLLLLLVLVLMVVWLVRV